MPARRFFRLPLAWRTATRIREDLDSEIQFHVDMRVAELVAGGLSEADARREAGREFGDVEFTRRYCETLDQRGGRHVRRLEWLGELRQDLRHALRQIARERAYAAVVIVTLALGIGANAAVFSVLNSVLLRPSPFPEPDRLVTVDENNGRSGNPRSDITAADYLDWRRLQRTFDGIAMHGQASLTFTGGTAPAQINGRRVSANFFEVLGARPALGRTFQPGEDEGVHRVLVLTNGVWRRLFGGDSSIVGRTATFGGDAYTIIGVLAPDFVFPSGSPSFFRPIDFTAAISDVNRARKFHFMHGFGRVKRGVSIDEARADLVGVARQLEREYPEVNQRHSVTVLPLRDAIVGDARPAILVLMGAAGFVLLIACANVANLALSRALSRRRELAVRAALGAGRGRLIRQILTETATLSLVGGAAGVLIAYWATPALLALNPSALPPSTPVHVDLIAVAFAALVAAAAGIGFGVVPAFAAAHMDAARALRDGSRISSGRGTGRLRAGLLVSQLALAVVLLVGAGLLVRTLARLQAVELGFDPRPVVGFDVPLSGPRFAQRDQITAFWTRLLDRLAQERELSAVAVTSALPLAGGSGAGLAIDGRPVTGPLPEVRYGSVSDDFFKTLGISLRAGRSFTPDDATTLGVVINEAMAKKFWPGQSPLGARVRLGPDPSQPWSPVVGVIADYHQEGPDVAPQPLALTSHYYDAWNRMLVTVRSSLAPTAVRDIVARAVRELDPAIPVSNPIVLADLVRDSQARRRFAFALLGTFAALALILALVGVYGVIAHGVTSRTKEFGIRVALGAQPTQVVTRVMARGVRIGIVGVALGIGGALLATRYLTGLLFGVRPLDAATFVSVSALLLGVTILGCVIPARRAARTDPMVALREE